MPSLILALILSLASLSAGAAETATACTCVAAKETNGWCDLHATGYVASVPIRSKMLYETLDAHGHDVDLSTFRCDSCKRAIANEGFCEEHRVGFVSRQAYFSRLTHELARGERKDPEKMRCQTCRSHAETHGWCETCHVGMLGRVAAKDRQGYERAVRAIEVLQEANKAAERCEYCAAAIVTDTECPMCRVTYKDGKPLPAASPPAKN